MRCAVNFGMSVIVAGDAARRKVSLGYRPLGQTAEGGAEL